MTYEEFIKSLAELVDGKPETAERIAKRANVKRNLINGTANPYDIFDEDEEGI